MICPAFQSTYVLEEDSRQKFFSLFGEDSLPKSKVFIKKNRYGMIVKVRYREKLNDLRTVKMKSIYPPPQIDSVVVDEDAFVNVNVDPEEDTLELEASVKNNQRYNNDQRAYMYYIGDDIARVYEKRMAAQKKVLKEREEIKALDPPKADRKTLKEERKRKKQEEKESKNKDIAPVEEEEDFELEN
ncbi:hypothetical protein BH23BAC1_BH23BAC1_30220 [soil metagenome]